MAEPERLGSIRHLNNSVNFQKEDKQKKFKLLESKAEEKRNNQYWLAGKAQNLDQMSETFQQNKIYKKAGVVETYEKLCHIQSL